MNLQHPKATELQSACLVCLHICRYFISAVRGNRTPSPFSRITGFQDRPGTSCGITAKNPRGGNRTRMSLRTHGSGPCMYNHFHAPGQILSTGEGGRTLKTLLLRQVRIPVPSLLQSTSGGDRTRKRPGFLARRIFQFCYRGIFCLSFSMAAVLAAMNT